MTAAEGWAQGQTRDGTAVALLIFSNHRDKAGMVQAPSDDQREERSVNPLLCACNGLRVLENRLTGQPILFYFVSSLMNLHLPANG